MNEPDLILFLTILHGLPFGLAVVAQQYLGVGLHIGKFEAVPLGGQILVVRLS